MRKNILIIPLSALLTLSSASSFSGELSLVANQFKNKAISTAKDYVQSAGQATLNDIFDKATLNLELNDGAPEFELGALKAYDENNANAFMFNQIGINRFDKRTTLNLGIGYRVLNDEQTWMGGINVFYDEEFPNNHKRSSVGAELISSAVKLRANKYHAISGFITDRSGVNQSAVDGSDASIEAALPYLPGAFVKYNTFTWKGLENATDLKGHDVSLGGKLSDNLSLSFKRIDYDAATTQDVNKVEINYAWNFGHGSKSPTIFELSDKPYQFRALEDEKYDLVKRENRIIKQKKFSATVAG